jgi:site-specific DNA-methyltransferase (adenine-specific)
MTLVTDPDFELRVGDLLELLPALEPASVDAVVTSPPYADARDDVPAPSPAAYPAWAALWLPLLLRALTPHGSLMLNLGRRFNGGQESTYIWETLAVAIQAGFRLVDTIVWHKVNGGGGRRTAHLIDRHEYVLWLAADPGSCYRGFDDARQPYSPATLGRYQRRWRAHQAVKGEGGTLTGRNARTAHPGGAKPGSVLVCSAGAEKGILHPSPMPPELAHFLVKLSAPRGALVLDPFVGSGTTALACRLLGRRCLGLELSPVHAAECAARLATQRLAVA